MSNNLRQQTVSGMIWNSIQRFGTMGVSFVANMFLARLLSPDDFGCIGMLAIFIALSGTFIDGGFGSALIQKKSPTTQDYSTIFFWNVFFGIALYTLLFFAAPFIASFYRMEQLCSILRVEGVLLIINSFAVVQTNQLRKRLQFKKLATIYLTAAVSSFVIAVVMAYCEYGVWSLVVQQLVLSLVATILLWMFNSWRPAFVFSLASFKELFGFGAYMMSSSLLNTLMNNLNGLLIGRFFNAATMGYFSQAKKMEDVSSTALIGVVEQVTYPILSEVQNDITRLRRILQQLNVAILYAILPLMLLIILLSKPIIILVFSAKWLPAVPFLQILAVQGIASSLQGVNYNAIASIGKSKVLFRWTIRKRVISITLMFLGLFAFGIYGLLWGMVLGTYGVVIINSWLVRKYIHYGLRQQLRDLLPTIMLGFATLSLSFLAYILSPFGMWLSAVIDLLLFLTLYVCFSWITRMQAFYLFKETVQKIYNSHRHG